MWCWGVCGKAEISLLGKFAFAGYSPVVCRLFAIQTIWHCLFAEYSDGRTKLVEHSDGTVLSCQACQTVLGLSCWLAWRDLACQGLAWLVLACQGLAWLVLACLALAWLALFWLGSAWLANTSTTRPPSAGVAARSAAILVDVVTSH